MFRKIDKGLILSIIATLAILFFAVTGIHSKLNVKKEASQSESIESFTKSLEENNRKLNEILEDLEKTEKALKDAREILERESREE